MRFEKMLARTTRNGLNRGGKNLAWAATLSRAAWPQPIAPDPPAARARLIGRAIGPLEFDHGPQRFRNARLSGVLRTIILDHGLPGLLQRNEVAVSGANWGNCGPMRFSIESFFAVACCRTQCAARGVAGDLPTNRGPNRSVGRKISV